MFYIYTVFYLYRNIFIYFPPFLTFHLLLFYPVSVLRRFLQNIINLFNLTDPDSTNACCAAKHCSMTQNLILNSIGDPKYARLYLGNLIDWYSYKKRFGFNYYPQYTKCIASMKVWNKLKICVILSKEEH